MKIGITQRVLSYNNVSYDSLSLGWYNCLKDHELTVISNRLDQDLTKLANSIDLLIISGGEQHPVRDYIETTLTTNLYSMGKPIIGVCHGFQFLTKYFGGMIEPVADHHNTTHDVVYNNKIESVNSYHSNRVVIIPNRATSLAHDLSGNCESWIMGNIGGVMWHPERMDQPFWTKQIEEILWAKSLTI